MKVLGVKILTPETTPPDKTCFKVCVYFSAYLPIQESCSVASLSPIPCIKQIYYTIFPFTMTPSMALMLVYLKGFLPENLKSSAKWTPPPLQRFRDVRTMCTHPPTPNHPPAQDVFIGRCGWGVQPNKSANGTQFIVFWRGRGYEQKLSSLWFVFCAQSTCNNS